MRRVVLLLISFVCILTAHAQYDRVKNWEEHFKQIHEKNRKEAPVTDCVLFIGSSTFRMWQDIQSYFPDSKIVNNAFGGSYLSDLIYYFKDIVLPHNPRQVVIYEGDNDLCSSKTPEEFMEDAVCLTRLIQLHFPKTSIVFVSIKPSPNRNISIRTKYKSANNLLKAYADSHDGITYVSIWDQMLDDKGNPNKKYFLEDGLHMNKSGYEVWQKALMPVILTK